jgi:hypothetical protein
MWNPESEISLETEFYNDDLFSSYAELLSINCNCQVGLRLIVSMLMHFNSTLYEDKQPVDINSDENCIPINMQHTSNRREMAGSGVSLF